MMKIDILTLFPEMFEGFLETSIIKRAVDKHIVDLNIHNFREYTLNKHQKVDDYPYVGGQGMVLACQPLVDAIAALRTNHSHVILMSPQGDTFNQAKASDLSQKEHLIIICGHYEGFDERIRYYVDQEISIGDYVLTGGELSSMVVSDAIIRLIDGAINVESHLDDSFQNGLLEYPQYTRPVEYDGHQVPEILLSGHHEQIRLWRLEQSIKRTYLKRPDLLKDKTFSEEEKKILKKIQGELKK